MSQNGGGERVGSERGRLRFITYSVALHAATDPGLAGRIILNTGLALALSFCSFPFWSIERCAREWLEARTADSDRMKKGT